MNRILIVAAFAFGMVACGQETTPATTAAPVVAVAPPAPTTAAAPAEPPPPATAEELPVPEDFETEASSGVTEANYRAELDRIAGEIAQQ